jgi:toxin YoeB
MRNIKFIPGAYNDYVDWLKTDKQLFVKITNLIRESAKTPAVGAGNPELLKHDYSGLWSRRINREHRLVYGVSDDTITIISCKYHYK